MHGNLISLSTVCKKKKEGKKKQEMRKTLKYVELGASDMGVKKKQQQQKQMNLWGLRLEN